LKNIHPNFLTASRDWPPALMEQQANLTDSEKAELLPDTFVQKNGSLHIKFGRKGA
jgi:hypothetical protein